MLKAFLFALTGVSSIYAESFIIAELFGDKNPQESWLELSLVEEKPFLLRDIKLSLEFRTKDRSTIEIEHHLLKPLKFRKKILIAAQENLGAKNCLSSHVEQVVVPKLVIKNGLAKVCVTLNQEKNCVELGAKDRFVQHTALYRWDNDRALKPHWFKEPCLAGHIFASPGLDARFCEQVVPPVFVACNNSSFSSFLPELSFRKSNIQVALTEEKVKITNSNEAFPLQARVCLAPKTSSKICHEIGRTSLQKEASIHVRGLSNFLAETKVFLQLRDLLGHRNSRAL